MTQQNDVISQVRRRCLKRSRQYTFKDLNQCRHLKHCREMPANIVCNPDNIISKGLGLATCPQNGLSSQLQIRAKQIKVGKTLPGYLNYIKLIPKSERNRNHPHTPTLHDIQNLSKRNFDGTIKAWKKQIHVWDNIKCEADIPYHLLTNRLLHERKLMSSRHLKEISGLYSWSPKRRRSPQSSMPTQTPSPRKYYIPVSEKKSKYQDRYKTGKSRQLDIDMDQKQNQNHHASDCVNHRGNEEKEKENISLSRDEAIECLRKCISKINTKQNEKQREKGEDGALKGDNFGVLVMKEFVEMLNQM